MLTENKFRKYILYAIGEIVLVVIGILIALQLNNLNEIEKVKDTEILYINALHDEFSNNLKEVEKSNESIVSNRELRLKLASWDGILASILFQEEEHSKPRYKLIDLMNKLGNGRKSFINALGNFMDMPNSNF